MKHLLVIFILILCIFMLFTPVALFIAAFDRPTTLIPTGHCEIDSYDARTVNCTTCNSHNECAAGHGTLDARDFDLVPKHGEFPASRAVFNEASVGIMICGASGSGGSVYTYGVHTWCYPIAKVILFAVGSALALVFYPLPIWFCFSTAWSACVCRRKPQPAQAEP